MLEVFELTCQRGDNILCSELSFKVLNGQSAVVVGNNGAGKSSLLKTIAGLMNYKKGNILYKDKVLFIGHNNALDLNLSPVKNLHFMMKLFKLDIDYKNIVEALTFFGLHNYIDIPVGSLSFGQQKKVALSRLLLQKEHKFWILDEPFSSLDSVTILELKKVFNKHLKEKGSILFASHELNHYKADKVIFL